MALPGNRATKNFFETFGFTARKIVMHKWLRERPVDAATRRQPPDESPRSATDAVRPEVCVGAIAVDDERLLLVRRGHGPAAGEWSIPGGRVEAGETLAEAVVRELLEETGVEGVCDQLVGWVERIGDEHHFVILDFAVDGARRPDEPPVAGDDAAEAAWVPLDEVADLRLVDGPGRVPPRARHRRRHRLRRSRARSVAARSARGVGSCAGGGGQVYARPDRRL